MPRSGDQYFPFRQNSDFFYLTGIEQEESLLLIMPDHPDQESRHYLFIIRPTPQTELWEGHKLNREEASSISGIKVVYWLDEFDRVVSEMTGHIDTLCLNFPENPKFNPSVKPYDYQVAGRIEERFSGPGRGRLAPVMTKLRMFKEPEEIDAIKRACVVTANAFRRIISLVKPGINECEVMAEITHEFIRSGVKGHAFDPVIAGGDRALVLHYVENNRICKAGDLLLLDFGAEYLNYAADCTRTIPVSRRFTTRQREIYNSVLKVLNQAIKLMIPGKLIGNFHNEVGLLLQEEHLKLGLYTAEDAARRTAENPLWKDYYLHGTSHSIGLDVHDPYDRCVPFAPGMVLSCEPAIYIREEKTGIRIENTILITKEGPVDLMKDIPSEAGHIEELMNQS